ncbi:unnamed protein product [Bathycoccus prasinos]|tara:strand:- start:785 stop:2617 length:1833 start_codon:yes stop_codon:yes gene_type:complete
MNFVKAQLEKAERFVENVEQKVAERVVPGLNNNNANDDDEEYSDSEWGEDGSIRQQQRRRRPKVVLSDDSDNEEEGKEEVAFEEKKKTTKSAFKVEDVASGYDANDRSAETTSAAFLTENAAMAIQTTTHSSPSKQLLGKPPSPPISVAKQQLAEQREREREEEEEKKKKKENAVVVVARDDEEYKLKEKIVLYKNKVQDLKSERDHFQRLLRDMQNEAMVNTDKMMLTHTKLERKLKEKEAMLKEKEEEIKRLNATEKIRNDAEDEAQSLTQESMASVLAGAKEAQMRAERQAEASSREIVSQREEFSRREADLEDQLERLSQDVAKVSQTSEERARALVTFERRAVAAENDHERLSEIIARLETSLAAETKRAERAEDDGEYERMKEQLESANGEMQKLRKEVDAAKRRADIAERDLKVRVGVLNGSSNTSNGGENNDGLMPEDQNELASLRKRSEEMTKLLYEKQRQLESLQGEKQTWSMRLERAKEEFMNSADVSANASSSAKRRANAMDIESGRNFASAEADIVPMEASRTFSRLAQNRRVGKVVTKAWQGLDAAAATLSDGVRLYPIARVAFFSYLFFIHMYAYFLLHKLQHNAHMAELHLHHP